MSCQRCPTFCFPPHWFSSGYNVGRGGLLSAGAAATASGRLLFKAWYTFARDTVARAPVDGVSLASQHRDVCAQRVVCCSILWNTRGHTNKGGTSLSDMAATVDQRLLLLKRMYLIITVKMTKLMQDEVFRPLLTYSGEYSSLLMPMHPINKEMQFQLHVAAKNLYIFIMMSWSRLKTWQTVNNGLKVIRWTKTPL